MFLPYILCGLLPMDIIAYAFICDTCFQKVFVFYRFLSLNFGGLIVYNRITSQNKAAGCIILFKYALIYKPICPYWTYVWPPRQQEIFDQPTMTILPCYRNQWRSVAILLTWINFNQGMDM